MDWQAIIKGLQTGLTLVQELAPAAAAAGPTGAAIGALVGKVAAVASSALADAQSAGAALSTDDLATLQTLEAAIRAENDALAKAVAAS